MTKHTKKTKRKNKPDLTTRNAKAYNKIGGHTITKPLTYGERGSCSKAFDQGFLYGELSAIHYWVKLYKRLRRFKFIYDSRDKIEVQKALSELDKAVAEYEAIGISEKDI